MSAKCKLKAAAKAAGETRYVDVKPCRVCGGVLRLTVNGACVECSKKRHREFYEANIERERANAAQYARNRREKDPVEERRRQSRKRLEKTYGITEAQYTEMLVAQNGCCAICSDKLVSRFEDTRVWKGGGAPPNDLARVDHCHSTGAIRGLLCSNCNIGLGKFLDDEKILQRAIRYLRASATVSVLRAA